MALRPLWTPKSRKGLETVLFQNQDGKSDTLRKLLKLRSKQMSSAENTDSWLKRNSNSVVNFKGCEESKEKEKSVGDSKIERKRYFRGGFEINLGSSPQYSVCLKVVTFERSFPKHPWDR